MKRKKQGEEIVYYTLEGCLNAEDLRSGAFSVMSVADFLNGAYDAKPHNQGKNRARMRLIVEHLRNVLADLKSSDPQRESAIAKELAAANRLARPFRLRQSFHFEAGALCQMPDGLDKVDLFAWGKFNDLFSVVDGELLDRLRNCEQCGQYIYSRHEHGRFCSLRCREKYKRTSEAYKARQRKRMRELYWLKKTLPVKSKNPRRGNRALKSA